MGRALIVYSSNYGQTSRIAKEILKTLLDNGYAAELVSVVDAQRLDISLFDTIVVGGSIRYGRHSRALVEFSNDNRVLFHARSSFFYSVSAVARRQEKSTPASNPYIAPFLARTGWTPDGVAVFAGKIDYSLYRFFDAIMIKLIMRLTNGPTDASTAVEFTDWDAVRSFADTIGAEMAGNPG